VYFNAEFTESTEKTSDTPTPGVLQKSAEIVEWKRVVEILFLEEFISA
jgi:hypothetical protein